MKVSKTLTKNDIGITGGHQAGIHIPKTSPLLDLFPKLDSKRKNPRAAVEAYEVGSGQPWAFNFIHYNNAQFGGTRDEYRLTGMTRFLREANAREGDEIAFSPRKDGSIWVELRRTSHPYAYHSPNCHAGSSWTVQPR